VNLQVFLIKLFVFGKICENLNKKKKQKKTNNSDVILVRERNE